jgi:hypothetical protein
MNYYNNAMFIVEKKVRITYNYRWSGSRWILRIKGNQDQICRKDALRKFIKYIWNLPKVSRKIIVSR